MECGRLIKSTGTKQELRPIRRPIRVFPLWREIGVDRYILSSLRANAFKTFIVSGGGIEFMRPWTEKVYGIPPERVADSSIKTKFELRDGKPVLVRLPELNSNDDKEGKPVDTRNFEAMCRMDVPALVCDRQAAQFRLKMLIASSMPTISRKAPDLTVAWDSIRNFCWVWNACAENRRCTGSNQAARFSPGPCPCIFRGTSK